MARNFRLKCPGCEKEFNYLQHPSTEPEHPRYCPLCGYDTESDATVITFQRAVTAPHIAKSIGKAGDMTYRMMEGQAEERITAAAEMTGQPREDFNDMKITNLKDNLREGDIAAMPEPTNPVTQRMAEMQARGLPVGFGAGAQYAAGMAAAAHSGPDAYAGVKTRSMVRQHHAAAGNVVTDTPTLEAIKAGSRG